MMAGPFMFFHEAGHVMARYHGVPVKKICIGPDRDYVDLGEGTMPSEVGCDIALAGPVAERRYLRQQKLWMPSRWDGQCVEGADEAVVTRFLTQSLAEVGIDERWMPRLREQRWRRCCQVVGHLWAEIEATAGSWMEAAHYGEGSIEGFETCDERGEAFWGRVHPCPTDWTPEGPRCPVDPARRCCSRRWRVPGP
jgi:hypothetical protein